MKKSLLTFLLLLITICGFGQSWMNTGNSLQRQTNGTYSNYRFNMGSPGFMYFYNKTQTDSLFNIAVGRGVTSFNTRIGAVTLLSGDVTTALGFTPENTANKTNTVSNSTTQYTSAKAVQDYTYNKAYADSIAATRVVVINAPADTTSDSYDLMQNAINFMGGKGTLIFNGKFYLNKISAGGLVLPKNAEGLIIKGQGAATIKLSANVSRAFDTPGIASSTLTADYKNISIQGFTINANNINGTSFGGTVTAVSTVTAGSTNWITVNVGSNASFFANGGWVLLPSTNTGTKNTYKRFRLSGGSTSIQLFLNSGESVQSGDIVKGASIGHVIIGTFVSNTLAYEDLNINYNNINLKSITAINIATELGTATNILTATQRVGVFMETETFTGFTGTLTTTDVTVKNVKVYGGSQGFGIFAGGAVDFNANVFFDGIVLEDCYHTTGVNPTTPYNSYNYLIGNAGFGNRATLNRCNGDLSGNVGIEVDAFLNALVTNCSVKNSFEAGYFHKNYSPPALTSAGVSTSTLNGAVNSSQTTITVNSIPTGVANSGYMTLDNTELVYYNLTYGSSTITVLRGANATTPVSHSTSGLVRFLELGKQLITYDNCSYENTVIGGAFGNGYFLTSTQATINLYPFANVNFINCTYKRTGATYFQTGEAVATNGQGGNVFIDGFSANVNGINQTAASGLAAGSFLSFRNSNYDAVNGAASVIPSQKIIVKKFTGNASGTLDAGGTNIYNGIRIAQGNYHIDFNDVYLNLNFNNTSSTVTQQIGILLSTTTGTNYISGSINNFKMASSGNGAPVGIWSKSLTTIGKLSLDNLDFSNMYNTPSVTNAFYFPYKLDAANAANIYLGIAGKMSSSNTVDEFPLLNPTISTSGSPKNSPRLHFGGSALNTTAGVSQLADGTITLVPIEGTSVSSYLSFDFSNNNVPYTNRFRLYDSGNFYGFGSFALGGTGYFAPTARFQIIQTSDAVSGGLLITNIAGNGGARIWTDASANSRLSANSSEANNWVVNGGGTGKLLVNLTTAANATAGIQTSTTAYLGSTTASTMLKTDASKNVVSAVANTDYLPVNNPTTTGTLTGAAVSLSGNLSGTTAGFTGTVQATNASIGTWSVSSTLARFGHSTLNGPTNYGFLQNVGGETFIGTPLLTITGSTIITALGRSQAVFTDTVGKLISIPILGTGSVVMSSAIAGFGSGTVTSVATGNGLTGGPITTTGTLRADTAILQTVLNFKPLGSTYWLSKTATTLPSSFTSSSLTSAAGGAFGTNAYNSTAYVDLTTDQTITSGQKIFVTSPSVPTPTFSTTATSAINQAYLPLGVPAILTTLTGVDTKTSANYSLYTVPSGKTAVITAAIVRCTAATSITNGPSVSLNVAGVYDIYANTALSALQTNTDVFGFSTVGMSKVITAGNAVTLSVNTIATGTAQTVEVTLIGYLR